MNQASGGMREYHTGDLPNLLRLLLLVRLVKWLLLSAALTLLVEGLIPAPNALAQPSSLPTVQVFLVFFDWIENDNVDPEAISRIELAAKTWRSFGRPRISVVGYTDRLLPPNESRKISLQMANIVANILVRYGVYRDHINIAGEGSNDNRVPTAPGVREPQNRRVEIIVRP
jgi:OOP family OmpA-OmpF porin